MHLIRARVLAVAAATLVTIGTVAACGSDSTTPAHNAADQTFILSMLHHHQRAIAVGQLAADRGGDPRVTAFGQLIVSQQTPEEQRLSGWVRDLSLPTTDPSAAMPDGYITDPTLTRLKSETGTVFDRDVLLASASSETGAAAMAQRELASGKYDPARTLATSIATAPTTQIPKLRELAAALPG